MTNLVGARRPALFWSILTLAVAVFLSCFAWARADAPTCPYYTMDRSGTISVDGMMPPNYCGGSGAPAPKPTVVPHRRTQTARVVNDPRPFTKVTPTPAPVTLVQRPGGHSYTYVALPQNGGYLIKRDGTPWATVQYNAKTDTWDLTDPNGSGALLLRVGPNPHAH